MSVRVPVPVWFAAAAFTLLLLEPQVGSSNTRLCGIKAEQPSSATRVATDSNTALWYAYRAASRSEVGTLPGSKPAFAAPPVPLH